MMMTVDPRIAWIGLVILAVVVWVSVAPWAAAFVLAIPYAWVKFAKMSLESRVEEVLQEMYDTNIGVQEHHERAALKDLVREWRGRYNEHDIAALFMAQRLRELLLRDAEPSDRLIAERVCATTRLLNTTSRFSAPDPYRMVLLAAREIGQRSASRSVRDEALRSAKAATYGQRRPASSFAPTSESRSSDSSDLTSAAIVSTALLSSTSVRAESEPEVRPFVGGGGEYGGGGSSGSFDDGSSSSDSSSDSGSSSSSD